TCHAAVSRSPTSSASCGPATCASPWARAISRRFRRNCSTTSPHEGRLMKDAAAILRGRAHSDVALGPFTTYRVGGPADLFLEIAEPADVERACGAVAATGVPVLVIGRGSNLLIADAGFRGLAVKLGDVFATVD